MERFIITVARETGSGGHNVTRRLSEALGIPYYDRDLLRKARKRDSRQRQRIDPNIAHVDAAFDRLDKRAVERGVMCDHRATTDKIGESGDGLNGRRGICHIGICNARELGNLGRN